MKRNTISAVIITFNEEDKIERCLQSVLPIADEIIVLDSFSTDGTEEICKRYPVRFVQQPFEGYIEQKNAATAMAAADYILSLDADEALSEDLQHWLAVNKEEGFAEDAYYFNRLNNYCGQWIKHGDYYPDRKLRLWRKGLGKWGGYNPHDKYEVPDTARTAIIRKEILHWSFTSKEDHVRQMKKFSFISATSYHNRQKKAGLFKPFLSAFWAFFNGYFIKLGWMDGRNGWQIARLNAYYTFWKYKHLRCFMNQSTGTKKMEL